MIHLVTCYKENHDPVQYLTWWCIEDLFPKYVSIMESVRARLFNTGVNNAPSLVWYPRYLPALIVVPTTASHFKILQPLEEANMVYHARFIKLNHYIKLLYKDCQNDYNLLVAVLYDARYFKLNMYLDLSPEIQIKVTEIRQTQPYIDLMSLIIREKMLCH